ETERGREPPAKPSKSSCRSDLCQPCSLQLPEKGEFHHGASSLRPTKLMTRDD
ncbi:hypothetical protein LINPERPRIM_LOCUS22191, partial [Linum perenne]